LPPTHKDCGFVPVIPGFPHADRASAEGLRERIESLIDDDEAAYVSVALIRAALRDTGPRPDGGIDVPYHTPTEIHYRGTHDDCIATTPHYHARSYKAGEWSAGPRPDSDRDCLEVIDMWRERALRAEDALTLKGETK
jgi:hypothetical protein